MRSRFANLVFKWAIAAGVLIAHVGAVVSLTTLNLHFSGDFESSRQAPVVTAGLIIDEQRPQDTVPIAEVALEPPKIELQSITQVEFESAEWGDISGVTASSSAPQLSQFQPVNPAPFALRAGLAAGQVAAVVLTVEILPDGTVGAVEVARGFGDPAVDAAAVDYARRLRWIPGTRDRRAETMRISLPVTLVWNA